MTTNGKPRLGSWTRIGIAASIVWGVVWVLDVGLFWPLYAEQDARWWSNRMYNVCLDPIEPMAFVRAMKDRIPFTSVEEEPPSQPLDERQIEQAIEQACKEGAQQAYQTSMQDSMQPLKQVLRSLKGKAILEGEMDDLIRVFLKFIDRSPELSSDSAANAVWLAMSASYPWPAKYDCGPTSTNQPLADIALDPHRLNQIALGFRPQQMLQQ